MENEQTASNSLTLFTKSFRKLEWTKLSEDLFAFTHNVGGTGRLLYPPKGTRNAKYMAGILFFECPADLDHIESELQRLGWLDVLQELRIRRATEAIPDHPAPPVDPIPQPKIDRWKPSAGLTLFEEETPTVRREQKVYFEKDKLIVDKWELDRTGGWEEEYFVGIAPLHFPALALMLGIESPTQIALMQAILMRYAGATGYDEFAADIRKHGIEHETRIRRD